MELDNVTSAHIHPHTNSRDFIFTGRKAAATFSASVRFETVHTMSCVSLGEKSRSVSRSSRMWDSGRKDPPQGRACQLDGWPMGSSKEQS